MSLDDTTHPIAEECAPDTRSRILATADAYFREIGYQKTTVADIARTLKMSPANVYRFFDSKKAINEAVLERLIGESEAVISASPTGRASTPPGASWRRSRPCIATAPGAARPFPACTR